MQIRSRVIDGILHMHCSFGRAKHGMEFKDEEEFDEYVSPILGDAISYSLDVAPSSPYVRKVGIVKREDTWNKPHRIMELITNHYKATSSKLHFGFFERACKFILPNYFC